MTRRPAAPPSAGLWLLARVVSVADRDMVVGDLTEAFFDRVDRGQSFNRLWFVAQAALFAGVPAVLAARQARAGLRRPFMERIVVGIRQAVRRLRHDWRYAAGVLAILGVGIGPAAAMLSVVNRVLLRPLDFHEPERLALVRVDLGQLSGHPGISPAEAIDLRRSNLFEAVETQVRLAEVSLGEADELVSLTTIRFTTGMLPMLGVQPVLGRLFTEADLAVPPQVEGAPPPRLVFPMLLDYGTWQTHFGGDPGVIGRVVPINNQPTEIVGVLPDGFRLPTGRGVPRRVDLYQPFQLRDFRNAWQFPTLARLRPGTTFEQVQAGLDAIAAANKQAWPQFYDGRLRYTIAPILDDMTEATSPALRAALAGVLLLLVIACANATALVIARLRTRERDVAVRLALGASRRALALEVCIESAVLGAGGALVGSLVAMSTIAVIRDVIPRTVPRWEQIAVGWELVAFSAVLAFTGLLLSGLLPIRNVSRTAAAQVMRDASVQGGRAEGSGARLVLAGVQIALTVVLVFACAQLVRSTGNLRAVTLGFDPDVLTFRVPYDFARYREPSARAELYQRIRDRVEAVPGVLAAGVTTHLPLSGSTMMDGYQADLSREVSFDQSANYQAVTPGYFETLRIPFHQGRDITDVEDANRQPVIVVDQTLVRTVFPGEQNVIGRTLRLGWGLPNAQIVGVVGHVRSIEIGRQVRPQIYAPIGNLFMGAGIVTVRTQGDPRALTGAIVEAIHDAGPGRAIANIAMLSDNVDAATSTLVAVTWLVTGLAASAGLLAAIGLYVVIAYLVHQRRRSSAIRAALGATAGQLMWTQARIGAAVMAVALPIGLLLASGVATVFATLIYGLEDRDPLSFSIAAITAMAVSAIGLWLPVWRAARLDVVSILKET